MRIFLFVVVVVCLAGVGFGDGGRRSVLFLLADDLRPDGVGALGGGVVRTPNLDRLVARGCVMEGAYLMGARNAAVCMPSRAMLLTGLPLGAFDDAASRFPEGAVTWPGVLREAGYATFGTGKWHQDRGLFNGSFSQGDSIFFGGMHDPLKVPLQGYDASGEYGEARGVVKEGRHVSEVIADSAVSFLEGQRGQGPFVAYVAFTAPHDPRVAPEEYRAWYRDSPPPLPGNFLPEHPFDNGELRIRDELLAGFPRKEEQVRGHIADYYAMVSHMDAQVGRILDALERSGLAEETLVVFTADNGLALGSHGLMGKQNLYEHSARVPLVMAGPGVPAGARRKALVYLNDVGATVLDWVGAGGAFGGGFARSFAGVLRGEQEVHREAVLLGYKGVQRAVREGDWKLIEYRVGGERRWQLFDLGNDPEERVDLAGREELAERVGRLRGMLVWE